MNTIMHLIRRDIKMSKRSILIKFGIFLTIFITYVLLLIYRFNDYQIINSRSVILEVFKGLEYLEISGGLLDKFFQFPTIWLFINGFIIYAIGDYFYQDIKINGKYILIRVKKMQHIYISKIVWSIFLVTLYYGVILFISGLLGYLFQNNTYEYIDPNYLKISTMSLIVNVFILYTLTSISLVVIFITLTLKIKPVYAFLIDIVPCILSLYVENKFFIGQHNLLIRHIPFDLAHNLTVYDSVIYNLIVTTFLIIIGSIAASKKEIF